MIAEEIEPAQIMLLDFHGVGTRPLLTQYGKEGSQAPKSLRARARRKLAKGQSAAGEILALYGKPIEQWDLEELAHGRPRNETGTFEGSSPKWLTRQTEDEALKRFKHMMRSEVQSVGVEAIALIRSLMNNNRRDAKGKPIVPPSTKADLAKWAVEHVIGKPTQTQDIKVGIKLEQVLAQSIVMPNSLPALMDPNIIDAEVVEAVIEPATTNQLEGVDDDDE